MRQDNVAAHKGAEVAKTLEDHQRRVSDLFRALLDSGAPAIRLADEEQARHHHCRQDIVQRRSRLGCSRRERAQVVRQYPRS